MGEKILYEPEERDPDVASDILRLLLEKLEHAEELNAHVRLMSSSASGGNRSSAPHQVLVLQIARSVSKTSFKRLASTNQKSLLDFVQHNLDLRIRVIPNTKFLQLERKRKSIEVLTYFLPTAMQHDPL